MRVSRQLQTSMEQRGEGKAPNSQALLICDDKYNFQVIFHADSEGVHLSEAGRRGLPKTGSSPEIEEKRTHTLL